MEAGFGVLNEQTSTGVIQLVEMTLARGLAFIGKISSIVVILQCFNILIKYMFLLNLINNATSLIDSNT